MNQDPKQIAMRYRAMFGPGWQGKMAACMDVQASVITKQVRGHCATQHWFSSYIEFFEVTPRSLWPERWAALREAADKVSGPWQVIAGQKISVRDQDGRGIQIFGPVKATPYRDFVQGLVTFEEYPPLMAKTDLEVK